jgi:hypothetical protein
VIIKFTNFYLIILSRSLYFYNLMKRYIIKKQKKKEKKFLYMNENIDEKSLGMILP